jgi:molecular chaperone DnaK (HSP70)
VSPYAFGPSFLGIRNGEEYPYCYKPIIQTNTPLPVTRTELYLTSYPHQEEVLLQIFQGEDPDALKNVPLGEFRVEGLRPKQIPNEVLCRMSLDLDGILQVTAIEKDTGLSKHISIEGAFRRMSDDEVAIGRQRLSSLCGIEEELVAALGGDVSPTPADEESPIYRQALELVLRARKVADQMHTDDAQEAAALEEQIQQALDRRDEEALSASTRELSELLFFVESAKS